VTPPISTLARGSVPNDKSFAKRIRRATPRPPKNARKVSGPPVGSLQDAQDVATPAKYRPAYGAAPVNCIAAYGSIPLQQKLTIPLIDSGTPFKTVVAFENS
jgi:hypothetical protein